MPDPIISATDTTAAIPLPSLLEQLDFPFTCDAIDQLEHYRDLLQHHNQVTNLTAIRDSAGINRRLIVESLRLAPVLASTVANVGHDHVQVLDLGSGGGVPGLVLAIAFPDIAFTLLDATRKKTDFLVRTIEEIGLKNTSVLNGRAEELAHLARWRQRFDVVTARAVAALPAILELASPFLRPGGTLLLPKGISIDEELDQAERAARLLGVEIASSELLPDAGSTVDTRLVIVRKVATTPRTYPRRSGVPVRNPLGMLSSTTNEPGEEQQP